MPGMPFIQCAPFRRSTLPHRLLCPSLLAALVLGAALLSSAARSESLSTRRETSRSSGATLTEALNGFLAPALGLVPADPGISIPAWADLREGRLTDGTPLVSRYLVRAACPEGLTCLRLAIPGYSSVGLLPDLPEATREVSLRMLASPPPGEDSRVDLLIDDELVQSDHRIPAGGFRVVSMDPGPGLSPGPHRIELRLAQGSGALRVLALELRVALEPDDSGPSSGGALGRMARRRRNRAPNPNRIPIQEYYPLDLGRQWTYDSIGEDLQFTLKVDAHLVYQGSPVARTRRMDKPDEYELTSSDAAGVRLWYRQDENGVFDMSDQPVPFSLGPYVKLGDRFEAIPRNTQNPVTGGFIRWVIDYRRFQSVNVPAGSFPQALRLRLRNWDTKTGLEIATMNVYLAKGLGMIRRDGRFVTVNFKHLLVSTR